MKRVIEGKSYNTETATYVCDVPCNADSPNDFSWHETSLYVSPKGTYFLAGEGGARSMWADAVEAGRAHIAGRGLRLIGVDEARSIAEDAGLSEGRIRAAGFVVEEG
jgi:hypothetical protein